MKKQSTVHFIRSTGILIAFYLVIYFAGAFVKQQPVNYQPLHFESSVNDLNILSLMNNSLWLHIIFITMGILLIWQFISLQMKNSSSQKKSLEEIIEFRTKQYKAEMERAEHSEKYKEEFLANMSHEMRTPLNAVVGMTNLLLRSAECEHQKKYLHIIKESSDSLLRMINNILDLAKIDANKIELEKINFSIAKVVSNVKDILGLKADEKKIQLRTEIDPYIPDALIGDPTRLSQVLMNLTCNAIKFTDEGSVTVRIKMQPVIDNTARILFSVVDTGIGIPFDKIDSVFESFTQAGCDVARKYGGTGLGLSICKKLVELQGGKIILKSETGKGSEFQFALSYPLAEKKKEFAYSKAMNGNSLPDNMNVLLVEDNLLNQAVASDTLQNFNENINVDIAANGKDAIEKIENNEYDVVLMDVQMPVMNGIEATEHIRNHSNGNKKNVPIIALTANASSHEAEKCISAGMNEFITKPFDPFVLLAKIMKVRLRRNDQFGVA